MDTLDDWLSALGVTAAQAKRGIPCPACGGDDRFHVQRGRRAVIGGCRVCEAPLYPDLARVVFGNAALGTPDRAGMHLPARTGTRTPPLPRTTAVRPSSRDFPIENSRIRAISAPNAEIVDDGISAARRLWDASSELPAGLDHPARLWIADRNLWRPECPSPPMVRGLKAADVRGLGDFGPDWPPASAAGCIVALAAPPEAWVSAWPDLPAASAVQLLAIDSEGRKAGLPGQDKRSRGQMAGSVVLIGQPSGGTLRVSEGLADALAVASRAPDGGPGMALLGTSGFRSAAIAHWLASTGLPVVVHADRDSEGQGQDAAGHLRRAIFAAGATATSVLPPDGYGDEAAWAADYPFGPVADGWRDYADGLDLPTWEACRQALATWGPPAMASAAPTPSETPTDVDRPRQSAMHIPTSTYHH